MNNRVLVAASQAALVAAPEVPTDLDRLAIARWAVLVECLPRRTFYASIERLPPGHLLEVGATNVSVRRFWRPDPSTDGHLTSIEAEVRFRELLEQALQRCVSLGPLGVLLSGGADSAAVATAATSVSRTNGVADPVALSYVMPDPEADERAIQTLVAINLRISRYEIDLDTALGRGGLISGGLSLSARRPLPCVNPWEPIWSHLAAEGARRGCAVIVSGEGGNPWFDPEEAEAADMMLRFRLTGLLRMWTEERRIWSRRSVARSLLWSAGLRLVLREAALHALSPTALRNLRLHEARKRFPADWTFSDPSLREELCEEWVDRDHLARTGTFREWGRMDKLESASLTAALGAENHFALARGLGIRFLDPPVDPDLVGYLSSLPGRLVNLNGEWKGLARSIVRTGAGQAAAAGLGHAWTGRFLATRMKEEAPAALTKLGGLPYLSDLGIVDGASFSSPGKGDDGAWRTRYYRLWQALACEAWLQGHC